MIYNVEELKLANVKFLQQASEHKESYLELLYTMAKFHKYDLPEQLGLHLHAPKTATACATSLQWEKFFCREIKEDSAGIPVVSHKNEDGVMVVYDVTDTFPTYEENIETPYVWQFKNSYDFVFDEFKKNEEEPIATTVFNLCEAMAKEDAADEILLPVAVSTAVIVLQRLGYELDQNLESKIAEIEFPFGDLEQILSLANDFSKKLLNPIGKFIQSEGRENNERKRSKHSIFGDLGRFKKEIFIGKQAIAGNHDVGTTRIDAVSQGDRGNLQQQILDFSGPTHGNRKPDRRSESHGPVTLDRQIEQHPITGEGNFASGALPITEKDSTELKEKLPPNTKRKGYKKTVFQKNIEAIYLLKTLEEEEREASSTEKDILKNYIGFGGLAEAFDDGNSSWEEEYSQLVEVLSPEEYKAARASVLNAHYTSDIIVKNMYQALHNMGFEEGSVLEPSCAIGGFFEHMPESMKKSQLYGVEIDPLTGRIAQKIHPEANIHITGFEKTQFNDNTFDLAIGNVPFGDYKVNDPAYNKENFLIHDYFLAKMIDKVRPGGLVAVITTKGTLDKKDPSVRAYLAQKADLVHAVRLPNNAFKAAGTEVTADILFLKKHETLQENREQPLWVESVERSDGCRVNAYFQEHPEHVLGNLEKTSTQYGYDLTCVPFKDGSLDHHLKELVTTFSAQYERVETTEPIEIVSVENQVSRPYSFFYEDNKLYYQLVDSKEEVDSLSSKDHAQMRMCIELREAVRTLIELQKDGAADTLIHKAQQGLNSKYDSYKEKYGTISNGKDVRRIFEQDSSYPLLRALELFDAKGEYIGKSDIFSKRTINPHIVPDHADTAADALVISMQEKGKVNLPYMENLSKIPSEKIIADLEYQSIYFDFEAKEYQLAEEYLSGDICSKIEFLESAIKESEATKAERVTELVLESIPPKVTYEPKNDIEKEIFSLNYTRPSVRLQEYIYRVQEPDFMVGILTAVPKINMQLPEEYTEDPVLLVKAMYQGDIPNNIFSDTSQIISKAIRDASHINGRNACKDPAFYAFMIEKAQLYKAGDMKVFSSIKNDWAIYERNYLEQKNNLLENPKDALLCEISQKIERLHINKNALVKVKPNDLAAADIQVELGAAWIPPADIEDFLFETLETSRWARDSISVSYSSITAAWHIEGKSQDGGNPKATVTFGTDALNAYKLTESALNLRDAKVYMTIYKNGEEKKVVDREATLLAQQKQELLKEEFRNWIWKDPVRRDRLEKYYNRYFNNIRPREYNGKYLTFPGMSSEIVLRKHQKDAIAHTLYGGNTLLAHCVGAGKTFEMVASIMEAKRLGISKKSMMVVPKHLTEQVGSEFLQLYPEANILIATQKDFEKNNRKEFCSKIATREWDAVIMGYTQFEKITVSKERQEAQIQAEIDEIIESTKELKANNGERFSIKQMESQRKKLELRLERLQKKEPDFTLDFEELGVDRLYVDEAHYFKNLFTATKMQNVAGVTTTDAQKTSDLYDKCKYLNEITNEKGIVFATGTPISNSMTELFTMQRYLQPNRLKKAGLSSFDAWAADFGKTTTAIELSPEGKGFRSKTRFAKFHNLPELMSMFKEIADIKTADMLNLPVPEAEYVIERIPPTVEQKDMVDALAERAEAIRDRRVNPDEDNMLLVTNDGRKLALDQRLINENLPDDPSSKVNHCVKNVFTIWESTKSNKSTQMIFCDLSTPGKEFNVYTDIRQKLMNQGIPEKEIAFIHDAKTEKQKDALFAKVRTGEIRVLLGSTTKMGTGTNVQQKLIALHDLDVPWRPSDLEQRSGRIVRQGNENKHVKIFRYVTEETFDAYLWQIIENKQRFIAQIMTSKSPVRSADDVDEATLSYAEIKAIATGNPLIKEKMELDMQIERLKMAKAEYLQQKHQLERKITDVYPEQLVEISGKINGLEEDVKRCAENTQKDKQTDKKIFTMSLNNNVFIDRTKAGEFLLSAIKNNKTHQVTGEYRGFPLYLKFNPFTQEYMICFKGKMSYEVEAGKDAVGNITRLDNALDHLEVDLQNKKNRKGQIEQNLEASQKEVEMPFLKEQELEKKLVRAKELELLLNLDSQNDQKKDMVVEKEQRIRNILSDEMNFSMPKVEQSYQKAALRELSKHANVWEDSFDQKIITTLFEYGYKNSEILETVFKHSPSVHVKESVSKLVEDIQSKSAVACR